MASGALLECNYDAGRLLRFDDVILRSFLAIPRAKGGVYRYIPCIGCWLVPEASALLKLAAACTATVDIGNRSIKIL